MFLAGAIDGFAFLATGAHVMHVTTSLRGLQFEEALKATGFFWPLLKVVELIGALCLLANRAPALGLALLAPVMAVIVLFHGFLDPQGAPIAAVLLICGGLLVRVYAPRYAVLFERSSLSRGVTPFADPHRGSALRAARLRGDHDRELVLVKVAAAFAAVIVTWAIVYSITPTEAGQHLPQQVIVRATHRSLQMLCAAGEH